MRGGRSRRRVFWWSLVLGFALIAIVGGLAIAFGDAAMPPAIAAILGAAVVGFVLFVARDEYRVARADGMSAARAVPRAIRKTVDAFILGK
jgi:hypothetical protein